MNEFDSLNHGLYSSPLAGLFGMPAMSFPSLEPTSFDDNRGGWTSESFMTTTVNGVTQTIHKRRDWDGTEHVTRTYPDGREVHTVNGVEQPTSRGYIAQHSESPESHHRVHHGSLSQSHLTGSRPTAPPPYSPPTFGQAQPRANGYGNPSAEPNYNRRRDRRHSDTRPVIPEPYTSGSGESGRRRWWGGR
jgi:DnaJ family protein B protein 6